MRISARQAFWWFLFVPVLAAAQASAPGKVSPRPASPATAPQTAAPVAGARPSPTPIPTPVSRALSSAPILTGPKYSPAQLDFGAIDYAASSRRTFSLTVPAAGDITLEFPAGSFVAADLRRVPPINLGGKGQSQRALVPPMKPVPASNLGQTEIFKWNFAAGEEMQLDILFAPSFSKDKNPGLRTATMKISGPGAITPWMAMIPMRGTVLSVNISTVSPPQPKAGPTDIRSLITSGKPGNPSAPQTAPQPAAPASVSTANKGTAPAAQAKQAPGVGISSGGPNAGGIGSAATVSSPVSALGPIHSPEQIDFGEVWDGDFAKKTFYLTASAYGRVEATVPTPFRISEFRLLVPISAGGKNPGSQSPNIVPQTFKRTVYKEDQPGPYTWTLEPGNEVQIDVLFQPKFDFGTMMAGQKTATMKISGPGPNHKWTLSVPLRGMFDGKKIQAPIVAQQREIFAVAGDRTATVPITITGLGTPVTGTIRAGDQVPQGVSVKLAKISVPAQKSVQAAVQLSLSNFAKDGVANPLELVFDDGSRSSKTQVDFTGLIDTAAFDSGGRQDCGAMAVRLIVSLKPFDSSAGDKQLQQDLKQNGPSQMQKQNQTDKKPQARQQQAPVRLLNAAYSPQYDQQKAEVNGAKMAPGNPGKYLFKGFNFDMINTRNVHMVLESGGVKIFESVLTLPTHNLNVIEKTGPSNSIAISRAEWARALQGPARFGCQLGDQNGAPYSPMRWAPAQ